MPRQTHRRRRRRRQPQYAWNHSSLGWLRVSHSVQGAELVAVGIAQIGDIEFEATALAHARRVFAGFSAIGDASRVKRVSLLGRTGGKADGAAIGRGRRLAIDRLRHRENAGRGSVENAVAVYPPRRHTERAKQRVIERLGFFQVIGSDHYMRKHPAFPSQCSPNDRTRSRLTFLRNESNSAGWDTEASRPGFSTRRPLLTPRESG